MRLAFRLAGMGKLLEAFEASSAAAWNRKLPGEQRCSLVLTLLVTQHQVTCPSWYWLQEK